MSNADAPKSKRFKRAWRTRHRVQRTEAGTSDRFMTFRMSTLSRAWCCLFFFQAEDGIRDGTVTGVQTCALPISLLHESGAGTVNKASLPPGSRILERIRAALGRPVDSYRPAAHLLRNQTKLLTRRSEERRVGKECRSRRWAAQRRRKDKDTAREG